MEKENVVSIWLGHFNSEQELQDYTFIDFGPDDEEIRSKFQEDFNIEQYGYDTDFSDVFFIEDPESIEDLLIGASYSESFWDFIMELERNLHSKYNSVIAVYDYDYCKEIKSSNRVKVDFVGSTNYKKKSWYNRDDD